MQLIPYKPEGTEEIATKMESLLADYQVYQQNVQRLMWEPKLRPYLDFGEKVQRLYQFTHQNTHLIAEQLVRWGHSAEPTGYDPLGLVKTSVQPLMQVQTFDEAIKGLIQTSQQLLSTVQEVFYTAAQYEEKQSMALMARLAWQLTFAVNIFHQERLALSN